MNVFSYDVETTTFQKGSPFSRRNHLVLGGLYNGSSLLCFDPSTISGIQDKLNKETLLVTFNGKFDIHWGRNYGLDFSQIRLWDCQLAEFMLGFQKNPYPSLNDCALKYGLPIKIDVVYQEYWSKGIDTDQIPLEILTEYLEYDCKLTYEVYLRQQEEFKQYPDMFKLFRLQCADLLVLEEMEYNGLILDINRCEDELKKVEEELITVENELRVGYEGIPINFASNDHLSCYLYGGFIVDKVRMPVGVFKTGIKAGLPRNKIIEYKYEFPRLVAPLKGSELLKDGYYSTDEGTLRSLKANKEASRRINLIIKQSKLSKLRDTYYVGIPKLIKNMDWENGRIFGQYNQCVARTGRIASSKPNQQNFSPEFKQMLVSRYAN